MSIESRAFDPATSPGMTDMMVTPESLDAWLEKNPQPSIDTLVKDIKSVLTDGYECTEEEALAKIKLATDELARTLAKRFFKRGEKPTGEAKLRMSNVGTECDRKLWYTVNTPEKAEPFRAETLMKFMYGDVLEELMLLLSDLAGHSVTGRQTELELEGVQGHRDAIIDDVVVDVKSASGYGFRKFRDHGLLDNDPFGYIGQLSAYHEASLAEGVDPKNAAFLAFNKENGDICLDVYDVSCYNSSYKIRQKKDAVGRKVPPSRGYTPEPDGKSGNYKLGTNCSYCSFKDTCWPELRTFIYSSGPRYLTTVAKLPEVREVRVVDVVIEE